MVLGIVRGDSWALLARFVPGHFGRSFDVAGTPPVPKLFALARKLACLDVRPRSGSSFFPLAASGGQPHPLVGGSDTLQACFCVGCPWIARGRVGWGLVEVP